MAATTYSTPMRMLFVLCSARYSRISSRMIFRYCSASSRRDFPANFASPSNTDMTNCSPIIRFVEISDSVKMIESELNEKLFAASSILSAIRFALTVGENPVTPNRMEKSSFPSMMTGTPVTLSVCENPKLLRKRTHVTKNDSRDTIFLEV